MSIIKTMQKYIAQQAETLLVHFSDDEVIFGTAGDGNFSDDGKINGKQAEYASFEDLELMEIEGIIIDDPFRIIGKGVFLYDEFNNEYKKICSDQIWLEVQQQK